MKRFNLRWKDDGKRNSILYCGKKIIAEIDKEDEIRYWDLYIFLGHTHGEYNVSTRKAEAKSRALKLVKEELAKLELVD